jgi:acyl-coenzyme A synthetase/AMP-(fatty) acid ligase
MAENAKIGERLIGRLIDEFADRDPTRVWASIPVDNDDLSKGYQDITYGQFANAINHAAWWLEEQMKANIKYVETIAYAGPKDLRYPVIAVAALKLGKKVESCP